MQKNLVKLSYLAQKVLQRGRVPVLQLVDLPSMLTLNNGRKMPFFVTPCILLSHTGFKNIFTITQKSRPTPKNGTKNPTLFFSIYGRNRIKISITPQISSKLVHVKCCHFWFSLKAQKSIYHKWQFLIRTWLSESRKIW